MTALSTMLSLHFYVTTFRWAVLYSMHSFIYSLQWQLHVINFLSLSSKLGVNHLIILEANQTILSQIHFSFSNRSLSPKQSLCLFSLLYSLENAGTPLQPSSHESEMSSHQPISINNLLFTICSSKERVDGGDSTSRPMAP